MGKLLLSLSLLSLVLLIVGSLIAPNSSAMWLASTSTVYLVIRAALCLGLVALLLTNPPRNVYLRTITGFMAFTIMAVAVYLTYQGNIKMLDGLSFMASGVSMGIAALEVNYQKTSLYRKLIKGQTRTQPAKA